MRSYHITHVLWILNILSFAKDTLGQVVRRIHFGTNAAANGYEAPRLEDFVGTVKMFGGMGVSVPIAGTTADKAYESHVWTLDPSLTYILSPELARNQTYDVRLGFAELLYCSESGLRVFSASVGNQSVSDIDVYAEVGCKTAYNVLFASVEPDTEGKLNVTLTRGPMENPFLSLLEITVSGTPQSTPPDYYAWDRVDTTGLPTMRHEACFIMVDGLAYLVGGRGILPVDVYDPSTQSWMQKTGPGLELHHMQCVAADSKIWIVSAWTGFYPFEENVDKIFVYDTVNDSWSTRQGLPEERRRGGAASVLYNGEIYVSHGNRGGHGPHAEAFGWLDKYNIAKDEWITNLPDAPNPRDHAGGAIVNGELCVAAGRDSGFDSDENEEAFFSAIVLETDCYDFVNGTWSVRASIPQGRAASAYGLTCDGKLMVAGGESFGQTWSNVDVFDGWSWTAAPELVDGRHGTGLAMSCICGQIHIASGSLTQGGEGETTLTETYFPMGVNMFCTNQSESTSAPTLIPTRLPAPTLKPTRLPATTLKPTRLPTITPTIAPLIPTIQPTSVVGEDEPTVTSAAESRMLQFLPWEVLVWRLLPWIAPWIVPW